MTRLIRPQLNRERKKEKEREEEKDRQTKRRATREKKRNAPEVPLRSRANLAVHRHACAHVDNIYTCLDLPALSLVYIHTNPWLEHAPTTSSCMHRLTRICIQPYGREGDI